jgi:NAD(P)-dependent dehydrogenase (short-subunit alcohol dehydrogenase family)
MSSSPTREHALVTGCSSGIGAAITDNLLDQGWHVTGVSRSRPELEHTNFRHLTADLADPNELRQLLPRLGAVGALVHAAGILRIGKIGSMDPIDGEQMWRLHVDAAAQLVQAMVSQMPANGRIVFIGSRVSQGVAGKAQYAASKAALVGLARSFAAELAPRGITVNVVAPGATDTPMLNDPARAASTPQLPPIGRYVKPREVAALVAFLLSDLAGSITGQQIMMCGGSSL